MSVTSKKTVSPESEDVDDISDAFVEILGWLLAVIVLSDHEEVMSFVRHGFEPEILVDRFNLIFEE